MLQLPQIAQRADGRLDAVLYRIEVIVSGCVCWEIPVCRSLVSR